jgi:CO/xanthine dehydrogenase FAD-binding subunit
MKPPLFDYRCPFSLDEALALRSEYADDSVVLAGGQSLMPMLNLRLARPEVLIDLGRVAELAQISELDGGVSLGAMTRQRSGAAGQRMIAAEDFAAGFMSTALAPDELNAVSDALGGARVEQLPLTPDRVMALIDMTGEGTQLPPDPA